MSYIETNLLDNENIIHVAHPSWISTWAPMAFLIISIICRMFFHSINMVADIAILISLSLLMIAILNIQFTEYAITNKRILAKSGILSVSTSGLLLKKVESIDLYQSLLGRIFDYGQIIIGGTGGSKDAFASIQQPAKFRNILQQTIHDNVAQH